MTTAKYMTILIGTAGLIALFPFFAEGQNGTQQNGMVSPTVVRGTGNGDGNGERISTGTRTFRVSAYCPCSECCGQFAGVSVASGQRRTASGYRITGSSYGRIVAAPRSIPFGTRFNIPGIGVVVAEDRGGSIKEAGDTVAGKVLKYPRLDLLCGPEGNKTGHQVALEFGVKYLPVTVVE
jgi:3D (Asp-Asp-Asp) domain-containing protein